VTTVNRGDAFTASATDVSHRIMAQHLQFGMERIVGIDNANSSIRLRRS